MDGLIERLVAGPLDVVLTPREQVHVEAFLSVFTISDFEEEWGINPERRAARDKLKFILEFTRRMAEIKPPPMPTPLAADPPAELPAADDQDGWVLMSALQWPPEFDSQRKRTKFLDDHSQQIRSRRPPRGNRREVYAADFTTYLANHGKTSFEQLDGKESPPIVPDGTAIPAKTYIDNATKLYGKIYAGKGKLPRK